MTKYNQTTESLKPHQQANTARKRQDSRQVNCGKHTVKIYPLIFFISALVGCLPAHAVTNSAFEMRNSENKDFLHTLRASTFFNMKNPLTSNRGQGYDEVLSRKYSVTLQRYCRFFVPKICLDSQSSKPTDAKPFPTSQGKTAIVTASHHLPYCVEATQPNKRPAKEISWAVTVFTESEPWQTLLLNRFANFLTQNNTGGYHA